MLFVVLCVVVAFSWLLAGWCFLPWLLFGFFPWLVLVVSRCMFSFACFALMAVSSVAIGSCEGRGAHGLGLVTSPSLPVLSCVCIFLHFAVTLGPLVN